MDTEYRTTPDTTFHSTGAVAASFTELGGGCGVSRAGARELTVELPIETLAAGPIWLCLQEGNRDARPRSIPLRPGEEILLGSGPSPSARQARIDDATVSALHCRVVHTGATVEVSDLGSRNGVRVSGARVERAAIPVGGSFEIGQTSVLIEAGERAVGVADRPLPGLIGRSQVMMRLAAQVRRIAALRLPVLLRGETGPGKALVARALHEESQRARHPFVAINAATISRELAESELFGHQRGAFTGAVRDRKGAFREASMGTLFLDEIGSVPLDVQAKLLRVVEESVVRPLGAEQNVTVDVRLVAATCEPIEQRVTEQRFRGDLYERLAVCVIQVPPLRDRPEDIPALARHLLTTSELGARELSAGAIGVLRAQRWPGNVRELRNVVVQAAVRAGARIQAEHVAQVISERTVQRRKLVPEDARQIYLEVGSNVSAAARRAELPRSTMRDLLRAAGVAAVGA
ncbi:MAG: sigma 54-interacting transcriptional regulator [Minicystis sp.]